MQMTRIPFLTDAARSTLRRHPLTAAAALLASALAWANIDKSTLRRYLITAGAVLLALLLGWALWWHYLRSPWTRDGRVRAEVVDIAAEISGKVVDLQVVDNQTVHKGDVLFTIDPVDYRLALTQAEANVQSRELDRDIAVQNSERRQKLGEQAVSAEERNTSQSTASPTCSCASAITPRPARPR
jgi:multidrug resistance efflux pump